MYKEYNYKVCQCKECQYKKCKYKECQCKECQYWINFVSIKRITDPIVCVNDYNCTKIQKFKNEYVSLW